MQCSFAPLTCLPLSCQSSGVEASDWPEYWPLIGRKTGLWLVKTDHVTTHNTQRSDLENFESEAAGNLKSLAWPSSRYSHTTVRRSPAMTTPVRSRVITREYDSARINSTTNNRKHLNQLNSKITVFALLQGKWGGTREAHFLWPEPSQLLDPGSNGAGGACRRQIGRCRRQLQDLVFKKERLD